MIKSIMLIVLSTITLVGSFQEQTQDAADLFLKGKKLIEQNCGECRGSTKAGLESGISQIEKALELGYTEKKQAFQILADAYNTLALVFLAPGGGRTYVPAEQEAAEKQRDEIYRKLFRLYPEDVDVLVEYSRLVTDENDRVKLYEKILEKDPTQFQTRFGYGNLLLKQGNWHEGFDQIGEAVHTSNNVPIAILRAFTNGFVDELRQPELYNLPFRCEATRVEFLSAAIEKIEWFSNFADYVRTTQVAIEEFKAQFKQEVNRIECTSIR